MVERILNRRRAAMTDHVRRLPRLFYALGMLNALTVAAVLYMGDSVTREFGRAVNKNEKLAQQVELVSELQVHVTAVNAPGNNVFSSHDVEMESALKSEALRDYATHRDRLRAALAAEIEGPRGEELATKLTQFDATVSRLSEQSDLTLLMYGNGNLRAAGMHMALMDRAYVDAAEILRQIVILIGDLQASRFQEQRAGVTRLERLQQLFILIVLGLVIGAVLYGQRLQTVITGVHRAREQALRDLQSRELRLQEALQKLTETQAEVRRMASVAEHTHNGVAIIGRNGKTEWVNPAFERSSGWTREQLVGQDLLSGLQGRDTSPEAAAAVQRVFENGGSYVGEILNYRPDGTPYWVNLDFRSINDAEGKPEFFIAVGADISQTKKRESELRLVSLVASHTNNEVIILDREGRIAWANEAMLRATGLGADALIGREPSGFNIEKSTDAATLERYYAARETSTAFVGETRAVQANGQVRWNRLELQPVKDAEGALEYTVVVITNITAEKRQAEENRRLGLVAAHTQTGVVIYDKEGRYTWANDAYQRIFGIDIANFIGKVSILFDPTRTLEPQGQIRMREAFLEKRAFNGEVEYFTREGELKWLQVEQRPVIGQDGEIECWVNLANDITAQKRQAEEVRRLSLVASSTKNNVIILGPNRRVEWVNDAFCKANGTSLADTVGKSMIDIGGGANITEAGHSFLAALEAGEPFAGEVESFLADNVVRWLRVEMQPVLAANGAIERFIVLAADITREKEQAEQMRRLGLVAAFTNNAVVITDGAGKIEWVNEGFVQLTGYSLDEVVTRKPGSLLQGPETDPATVDEIRTAIEAGKACDVEIVNYTKDRLPYWVRLQITPIRDARGVIERFIAIESDISRQKQQAEASRQLALVAAHTHNAVLLLERDHSVQWLNAGFTRLYGYTLDDLHGRQVDQILTGEMTDSDTAAAFARALRGRQPYTCELLNDAKTGETFWVSVDMTPVIGESGDVERYVVIIADISARKESEALVAQSLEKERQMNQQQRRFVSVVSHEFRTPLAIIDGAAQRLVRNVDRHDPTETLQRVARIRGSVNRMTELIDTMLSTARLEEGRIEVKWQSVVLADLAGQIADRQRSVSNDFEFNLSLEPARRAIEADPKLLDQVITNLLSNAVKYSGESRAVDLVATAEEEFLALSVRDYGIGIPAAELPRMFGRFFRASTSTGIPGTGIGLNLVKELVELHGGNISLESVEGQGSTFTVRLPWRRPSAAITPPLNPQSAAA
jgi:PAS domain S-box-containing protein